jgi:hypothetical protein
MKVRSAIISLVEDGAEWLLVQSKTLVKNLNAEFLGGKRFDQYFRKKVFEIGDGQKSSFLLDHNLDCDFISYSFLDSSGKVMQVEHSVEILNKNTVVFAFNFSPSMNQFKILIIG